MSMPVFCLISSPAMCEGVPLPTEAKLSEPGADTVGSSPDYLGQVVKKELAKWPEVIKAAKIRVD